MNIQKTSLLGTFRRYLALARVRRLNQRKCEILAEILASKMEVEYLTEAIFIAERKVAST